jgi:tetratricopeptide (TPR) repeat protein
VLVVLVTALTSLALPWLADRKVSAAYTALDAGVPGESIDEAEGAARLNPFSLEPLFAESLARSALGDLDGARASLRDAVEVQPADATAWYELGLFELDVAGDPEAALGPLQRARELDPYGPAATVLAELEGSR